MAEGSLTHYSSASATTACQPDAVGVAWERCERRQRQGLGRRRGIRRIRGASVGPPPVGGAPAGHDATPPAAGSPHSHSHTAAPSPTAEPTYAAPPVRLVAAMKKTAGTSFQVRQYISYGSDYQEKGCLGGWDPKRKVGWMAFPNGYVNIEHFGDEVYIRGMAGTADTDTRWRVAGAEGRHRRVDRREVLALRRSGRGHPPVTTRAGQTTHGPAGSLCVCPAGRADVSRQVPAGSWRPSRPSRRGPGPDICGGRSASGWSARCVPRRCRRCSAPYRC